MMMDMNIGRRASLGELISHLRKLEQEWKTEPDCDCDFGILHGQVSDVKVVGDREYGLEEGWDVPASPSRIQGNAFSGREGDVKK